MSPAPHRLVLPPAVPDHASPADDTPAPITGSTTSSVAVSCDPHGYSEARRWTSLRLQEFGLRSTELSEDAELIVSELLSNAVQHGAAPLAVALSLSSTALEVAVTDGGGPPYLFGSLPQDPTATRGRGLAIVATLTPAWGVRALRPGPGKTVWCRLAHDATV